MRTSLTQQIQGVIQVMQDGQPAAAAAPTLNHFEVNGLDAGLDGTATSFTQVLDGTGTPIAGRFAYNIDHFTLDPPLIAGDQVTLRVQFDVGGQAVYADKAHAMVDDTPPAPPPAAPGLPYIN